MPGGLASERPKVLNKFKTGGTHMGLVREVNIECDVNPYFEIRGVGLGQTFASRSASTPPGSNVACSSLVRPSVHTSMVLELTQNSPSDFALVLFCSH